MNMNLNTKENRKYDNTTIRQYEKQQKIEGKTRLLTRSVRHSGTGNN